VACICIAGPAARRKISGPIWSSGSIFSANPARATNPGIPQTTLVASSCTITRAPAATNSSQLLKPSCPMPVRMTARVLAPYICAQPSGIKHPLRDGKSFPVVPGVHEDEPHRSRRLPPCDNRREQSIHPGTRGSPARHSRTGKELFADNLEANREVKIGGICCAITTGTGKLAGSAGSTLANASGPPVETPMATT